MVIFGTLHEEIKLFPVVNVMVADRMGLNVWELKRLANRHPRVNILQRGSGVGGHCIAVDPWFIVHGAPDQSPQIRTARNVNDGTVDHVIA